MEGTERTDLSLDERAQIIGAQSSDPAQSYSAAYNSRGQIVNLKSASREVSFEYDANGNEIAMNHSEVGRFTYARDTAGRVMAENLPSGLSFFNEYDARGSFTKQSDSRGNAVKVERDAGGLPIAYIRADGKQRRAVRDEGGRVIRETNYDGSVRSFTYNVRGALIEYRSPGNHRRFEYDHRGRLKAMIEDDGSVNRVERDDAGRIRHLSYSNGVARLGKPLGSMRWAHASALQDPPMPPPDCCGEDVVYTDVWAHYWEWGLIGGGAGGGGEHPPLQEAPPEGGTGGRYDPLECAGYITACFMGIMLYPAFVAALDAACPETFGITCFAALVVMVGEPLLAIIACAQALNKCRLH